MHLQVQLGMPKFYRHLFPASWRITSLLLEFKLISNFHATPELNRYIFRAGQTNVTWTLKFWDLDLEESRNNRKWNLGISEVTGATTDFHLGPSLWIYVLKAGWPRGSWEIPRRLVGFQWKFSLCPSCFRPLLPMVVDPKTSSKVPEPQLISMWESASQPT